MKHCYVDKNFQPSSLDLIDKANSIIDDYETRGFRLTLRQLYYQFVARNWLPNRQQSYKSLGSLVNDARWAGLIDWEAIVDRTRQVLSNPHWSSPAGIIRGCAQQFRYDLWEGQPSRPRVWIEKQALIDVIASVCRRWDVEWFACRGNPSASILWGQAQSMRGDGDPVIFYLGDHDPTGLDIDRDIHQRLSDLDCPHVRFERLALTMEQVRAYDLPPNPAKLSDSRAGAYVQEFGYDSWELDALEPEALQDLVSDALAGEVDIDLWEERANAQSKARELLASVSKRWDEVAEWVEGKGKKE